MGDKDKAAASWKSALGADTVARIRELVEWVLNVDARLGGSGQESAAVAANLDELFYDIEVELLSQDRMKQWRSALDDHQKAYPTHGVRCICMDTFARQLQMLLEVPKAPFSLQAQEEFARRPEHEGGLGLADAMDAGIVGISGHGQKGVPQAEGLDEETGCGHRRHVDVYGAWVNGSQSQLRHRISYIMSMVNRSIDRQ